ncbi:two-component sensor histidine kinase [bacterium]|nr:two-component sensor histidine kinase [bacterium]
MNFADWRNLIRQALEQARARSTDPSDRWDLAAGRIIVRMRWLGILMGILLVETRDGLANPSAVRAFLALGAGFASLDTAWYFLGEVFLKRLPLAVSALEALFIGLLCYHDTGLESPFRWYYLMSLICVAIRYSPRVAWATWAIDSLSLVSLAVAVGRVHPEQNTGIVMTIVMLAWATWASSALAGWLKQASGELQRLNDRLRQASEELEARVAERSEALRLAQARVIHQEKMAAFGLLSAGIAHEIGNPMAAISSLLQILRRRKDQAPYEAEKLALIDSQLQRISRTVRELVHFSRPASDVVDHVALHEIVVEVLGILKYYHRTSGRTITTDVPADLPRIRAVRDHLNQIVLNLVFNAIDATADGGKIRIQGRYHQDPNEIELTIADDGRGIRLVDQCRMFQPYFTTKPSGTGLGLYVCRQIMTDLGGRMHFETEEGRGTSFRLHFPVAPVRPLGRVLHPPEMQADDNEPTQRVEVAADV